MSGQLPSYCWALFVPLKCWPIGQFNKQCRNDCDRKQPLMYIRSVSFLPPWPRVGGEWRFQHLYHEISRPLSPLLFAECPSIPRLLWSAGAVSLGLIESVSGHHSVTPTTIPGISSQRLLNLSANSDSSSSSPGGLVNRAAAHLPVPTENTSAGHEWAPSYRW